MLASCRAPAVPVSRSTSSARRARAGRCGGTSARASVESDAKQIADWAERGRPRRRDGDGGRRRDRPDPGRAACAAAPSAARWSRSWRVRGRRAEISPAAADVADRSSFVLADLLETPDAVGPRTSWSCVVSCAARRTGRRAPRPPPPVEARRTLLVSYPRDRSANRSFARLQNAFFALMRKRFRVFVHPPAALERAAARARTRRSRTSAAASSGRPRSSTPTPDTFLTNRSGSPDRAALGSESCGFIAIFGLLAAIAILVL